RRARSAEDAPSARIARGAGSGRLRSRPPRAGRVGPLTALAALCGVAFAAGMWMVVAGIRGTRHLGTAVSPRWRTRGDRGVMIRLGLGATAFLVAVGLTGWPVAAVLIGALAAALP